MEAWIRDTAFSHVVRFLSRGRYLKYPEEKDPTLWKKWVNEEKSGHAAHHGTTEPLEETSDAESERDPVFGGIRTREAKEKDIESGNTTSDDADLSSRSRLPEDGTHNQASGVKIDPEKGRDIHVIDFLPGDPDVHTQSILPRDIN